VNPSQDHRHALQTLLSEPAPNPRAIASLLDGLGSAQRIESVQSLRRWELPKLYEAVEGFAALRLEDLVPAGLPSFTPVRHFGRNSLPVFSLFEKRFYRTADAAELGGANFQTLSPLTGPGYFTARLAERGEIAIDYQKLPTQTPPDWPELRDNARGISRLVYGYMIDTLRRVSEHVSIGSASRGGKPLGAFFALCRQDSAG
jgi:hypothetical protein